MNMYMIDSHDQRVKRNLTVPPDYIILLFVTMVHTYRNNKDSFVDNLMLGVQLADVSTRCSSHPQGKVVHKRIFVVSIQLLQLRAMSLHGTYNLQDLLFNTHLHGYSMASRTLTRHQYCMCYNVL